MIAHRRIWEPLLQDATYLSAAFRRRECQVVDYLVRALPHDNRAAMQYKAQAFSKEWFLLAQNRDSSRRRSRYVRIVEDLYTRMDMLLAVIHCHLERHDSQ